MEVNAGKLRTLRVWGEAPGRLAIAGLPGDKVARRAPAAVTPGAGKNCENPCGAVPCAEDGDGARVMDTRCRSLEEAAMGGKARESGADWRRRNRARQLQQRSRLRQADARRGSAKATLSESRRPSYCRRACSRLQRRGRDDVTLRSDRGGLIQITRLWVKRDGRWQETLSYQTAVTAPRSSY